MLQRAGIVDLGSNTTRLVIYEYEPGKFFNLSYACPSILSGDGTRSSGVCAVIWIWKMAGCR